MPLPDATPSPNKANIYEQLSSIKLEDLTRSQLDVIRNPLFLNSKSEDVLRRINLIGQSSNQMSQSGPIPGLSRIQGVSRTSDGTSTLFQPEEGEVFQLVAADITAVGGGIRFKFQLYRDSTAQVIEIKDQSVTSATDPVDFTTVPLIIDNTVYLRVNISAIGVGETGSVNAAFVRLR